MPLWRWCSPFPACQDFEERFHFFIPHLHCIFLCGDQLACIYSTLQARISPQWLREQRLWPSVPWWVACELVLWQVRTLCLGSLVRQLWVRWIKGVHEYRCNLPPALVTEWPRSFTCHCSNRGVEQTPKKKSQHTKLTLEKKVLLPLLPGFKLASFPSWVWRCTNKPSWLTVQVSTAHPLPHLYLNEQLSQINYWFCTVNPPAHFNHSCPDR